MCFNRIKICNSFAEILAHKRRGEYFVCIRLNSLFLLNVFCIFILLEICGLKDLIQHLHICYTLVK